MKNRNLLYIILLSVFMLFSICFAQDNTQVGLPEGAIARLGKGGINVMKFSIDGTRLAVGTSIGVWLYDVHDGKEKALFKNKTEQVDVLAISSDGNIIASGGNDKPEIHLWNLATGHTPTILTLTHKFIGFASLVFSQDNNTLISLGQNGYITEWEVLSGKKISEKQFNNIKIVAEFSHDRTKYVSGNPNNGELRLWDVVNGKIGETIKLMPDPKLGRSFLKLIGFYFNEKYDRKGVETLVYSYDSNSIASAHEDNIIRIWDPITRVHILSLIGHTEYINTLAFSPDNTLLASGGSDNKILLWDVKKGHLVGTIKGHYDSIRALVFSPAKNHLLASGSSDGTLRLWDVDSGKEHSTIATGFTESVQALSFSNDHKILCSAASNGNVQLWDVIKKRELPSPYIIRSDLFNAFVISQDAKLFASNGSKTKVSSLGDNMHIHTSPDRRTRLWNLPTGDEIKSFKHQATALTISADKKMLAAITRYQGGQIWNIHSGEKIESFAIDKPNSSKLLFSPNGKYLAIYGYNNHTQVIDIPGKQIYSPNNITDILSLAFSPDNNQIATKHSDGISLWNLSSKGLKKHMTLSSFDNRGSGKSLIYSPNGKILLETQARGNVNYINLWEIDTGAEIGTVSGHTDTIETLVFSHDGKILASGSLDGTILLWEWDKIIMKVGKNND